MNQRVNPYPSSIAPWRQSFSYRVERGAIRATDWLLAHWLDLLNWGLGLIVAGALLTPVLAYLGIEPLAGQIFRAYHSICEQIPAHSFYIFGHQMAMCARNFTLYASLWVGTLIFRVVRQRLRPLPWPILVLFLLPMALDGGTQMVGLRESNAALRIITGLLFGMGICWFALPFVQDAVNESQSPVAMPPQRG